MLKQREVTARTGWLLVAWGAVLIALTSFRDWSHWPDLRTLMAALVIWGALGVVVIGFFVVARYRR